MFTGLVAERGTVSSLAGRHPGASLTVKAPGLAGDAAIGDSISVNGVCLTVVTIQGSLLSFDLSDETMQSTNLGNLKPGDSVNLEPSLRADGKLGGHFVTGHVDAVGKIVSKTPIGNATKIVINASPEVTRFLVEKGSIAVDGISLTVVDVSAGSFSVVIIPHTASLTTIGFKGVGDRVNLEADILGKYVAKFLGRGETKTDTHGGNLMKSLMEAGFISED